MNKKDLLIEIGTEELPPKALKHLATAFADEIHAGLEKNNLGHKSYKWFATPRRLAVVVDKLVTEQADRSVTRRGPALSAAYDDSGTPTRAAEGFARSCGVGVADLDKEETDKGSWLTFSSVEKGQTAMVLIPDIIQSALSRLPIPKRMRWADRNAEFVRPVHWSIVMLGKDVVPCDLLGTQSGNESRGHRFHHAKKVKITSPASYAKKLKEKAYVIADFDERKNLIREIVSAAGEKLGGKAYIEEELLDEVTSLVEWPVAITGSFEEKFLQLPREVLVSSMQDHQKYFAVTDNSGERLLNYFITVSNIESKIESEIKKGNEKVIRPRLSDADFFWQRDCRQTLEEFGKAQGDVIFQKQLGSLADKTERVKKLCAYIANQLNYNETLAVRAASLAKCDLFTEMVGEFPDLQGVMGRYYAEQNGEAADVALALDEQYMPRFAGDSVPVSDCGKILALSEKLDTLVGIFAIGQAPTGEKDPFALRRAALGCLRIIIESELKLDLQACLEHAAKAFQEAINANAVISDVFAFMMERLRRYYLDKGFRPDIFDAVSARQPCNPYDFHLRIQAVTEFSLLPEADSLAAANKRISNILKQSTTDVGEIDPSLLQEAAERNLGDKLDTTTQIVSPLLQNNDYAHALKELAGLRDTVDDFFDQVMVMSEDENLKNNRLALLRKLNNLFLSIADISRLQS